MRKAKLELSFYSCVPVAITITCGLCKILIFFTTVKNDNFHMKNCDIFLIFAQNIDCRYILDTPQ